jgi:anti-anti-sigma factor
MALNVHVTKDRSFSRTVHLQGRLDDETSAVLDGELKLNVLADSAVHVIVFDLANLEYISSAGLRSIFSAQKAMASRSGKAVLVNARPQVQKVFEIVKATDISAVFANIQELDRYLDTMQRKVVEGD